MKHEMIGERRKSRFDPHLAERIEAWDRELTIKEEAERLRKEREERLSPKPAEEAKVAFGSGYALMDRSDTYALGMHALREVCGSAHPTFVLKYGSVAYRPLTFEENIRARLEDYNTLENPDGSRRGDKDRKRLFNTWLDSCTGIAYKKGTTVFKIITMDEDLIGIPENFSGHYIQANYSQLQGAELDRSQGKYNQTLALDEVLEHRAWNEAVTDKALLNEYANLVFRLNDGNNMGFCVRRNIFEDELRALCVYNFDINSSAGGDDSLNYGGRFVRVAPARNLIAYSQML